MTIFEIRKNLSLSVFTHDILASVLRNSVSNINEKISKMVKKGS